MKPSTNGEPTTIVGPTIIIRGRLKSDEDLVVEGRIEAEITSTKALVIENSGIVKASMQVKSARISGVVVGNVTAEAKVEIAPDGRVVGDILSPKIVIRDGAAFRGRIDMPDFDAPRASMPESMTKMDFVAAAPKVAVEPAVPLAAAEPEVPAPVEPAVPPAVAEPDAAPAPWAAQETPPDAAVVFGAALSDALAAEPVEDPFAPAMPPPRPAIAADRDRDRNFKRNKRF